MIDDWWKLNYFWCKFLHISSVKKNIRNILRIFQFNQNNNNNNNKVCEYNFSYNLSIIPRECNVCDIRITARWLRVEKRNLWNRACQSLTFCLKKRRQVLRFLPALWIFSFDKKRTGKRNVKDTQWFALIFVHPLKERIIFLKVGQVTLTRVFFI